MPKINEQVVIEERKPGFLAAVSAGIAGALTGGVSMAIVGGVIGAVTAGAVALIAGPSAVINTIAPNVLSEGATAVAQAAFSLFAGGVAGASALTGLGATAGMINGVMQYRDSRKPRIEEIAKIAFAQGVEVGHAMEMQEHQREQTAAKWAERVGPARGQISHVDLVQMMASAHGVDRPH